MILPDTIGTETLTLRIPRMSDTGLIELYAGDERVAKSTARIPHPYPPGAAEQFVTRAQNDRESDPVWAIDGTKSGRPEFIGIIGFHAQEDALDIGYWVGPPFWGGGVATEAAMGLVKATFRAGAKRLTASYFEGNEGSAEVLRRVGFRPTDTREVFGVAAGRMMTAYRHELTADQFVAAEGASAY
ncbi:MAG: GNAT family protein [Pseudomonadota bacterium]